MEAETMTEMKYRFNKEKETWTMGILVWAICFLAIQIMMNVFPWLRYAGIFINVIILVIVFIAHKNAMKRNQEMRRKLNGKA